MVITYHGRNYFKIQSGNFTVLVDPTDSRSFRGANLILNTLKPSFVSPPQDDTFWVDHQGEYEVKDARVYGWSVGNEQEREKTLYRLTLDSITILILGHLSKEPSSALQENFAGSQIVIIPAGGKPYLSETAAAKLIRQIEPSLIIPSLFSDLKPFLKEIGGKYFKEEKLVLKSKDLKAGAMEIRHLI